MDKLLWPSSEVIAPPRTLYLHSQASQPTAHTRCMYQTSPVAIRGFGVRLSGNALTLAKRVFAGERERESIDDGKDAMAIPLRASLRLLALITKIISTSSSRMPRRSVPVYPREIVTCIHT